MQTAHMAELPAPPMRSCPHFTHPEEQEAAIAIVDFHPTLRGELKNTYLRVCPHCAGMLLSTLYSISEGRV